MQAHLLAELAEWRDRAGSAGAADREPAVAAMLAVAGRLTRLFELPHPTAPGLCLVGAVVDPAAWIAGPTGPAASATGKGADRRAAVLGCLGEAAEYLSQQAWGDETLAVGPAPPGATVDGATMDGATIRGLLDLAGYPAAAAGPPVAWTGARRLHDGAATWLPATLCYRHLAAGPPAPVPRIKPGSGCAVGATPAEAQLHGVLELVERDAVALWWLGGRPARRVAARHCEAAGVAALMARLRRGRTGRRHWLLDITTGLAVPAVVSVSCEADGRGLACGFAARLDMAAAIRAAILEMCQMEIAIHLVHLKRAQQGEAALDAADQAHLRRCRFDVAACPALLEDRAAAAADTAWPDDGPAAGPVADPATAASRVAMLARHLTGRGVHIHGVDLTRDALGIPAFRAFSCDLQPLPGTAVLPRLAQEIERSGGGPGLGGDIEIV